jgi:hypothetical protein
VKKNKKLIIGLFIGLGILLVIYFTANQNSKRYQWNETYKTDSDQPYGTQFIQRLLAHYRPGQKFIFNDKTPLHKLLDTAKIKTKTDYVLIGQDIFLEEADKNALVDFISAGNDALISTVHLPLDIIDLVHVSECDQEVFLTDNELLTVNLNFFNTNLKANSGYTYRYRFGKSDQPYFWNTLNPDFFCDSIKFSAPLGYVQPDKINFFKFSFGKGNLYIHTNPIVFTNYFLTSSDKAEYASGVFSYLRGEAMIWDDFSKLSFMSKNNSPEMSPLSYILQQDSLRYAWWLMLASALAYTLFTAKRKQRVIPVLEEKTNTSLEFVKIISALHFQNGNHHNIARKKMKYFFYFVRDKYGLQTQNLSESYMKRLSEKSKVELHHLQLISHEFNHVERDTSYDSRKLVYLYEALDKFYKNCK